jgi:hypothetical protein
MRAHLVKDGIVVNTLEVDSLDFMPGLIEATEGAIGWTYANGVFTAPSLTAEDVALLEQEARLFRDRLLRDSDWTQLPDVQLTIEQQAAWAVYRQVLRDVPQQEGFPSNVNWPAIPS